MHIHIHTHYRYTYTQYTTHSTQYTIHNTHGIPVVALASQEAGYEQAGHALLVARPVLSILLLAKSVVSKGSVHQQNEKVYGIEVGGQVAYACEQAPGKAHTPVTGIVYLARHTPPARGQQLGPAGCGHPLQVPYCRPLRVTPERVLLAVRPPEDGIACQVEQPHSCQLPGQQAG